MMLPRRKLLAAGVLTTASLALQTLRVPNAQAQPQTGDVLYAANWWAGWDGWPEAFGWKLFDGMLINDGSGNGLTHWIEAPYRPGENGVDNYAVEAEIRRDGGRSAGSIGYAFGLVSRSRYLGEVANNRCQIWYYRDNGGYSGVSQSTSNRFDSEWHTYRLEARGNSLTLKKDGGTVGRAPDNRFLQGGLAGLTCDRTQVSVRDFRIIAL
jgi:hypothetical protein